MAPIVRERQGIAIPRRTLSKFGAFQCWKRDVKNQQFVIEPRNRCAISCRYYPLEFLAFCYDCRSTFCSRMYAAGIQPVLIELLMGHAGSGLIHTYAKADDDFKRDAAAKLEAFITSKTPAENTSTTSTTWVN